MALVPLTKPLEGDAVVVVYRPYTPALHPQPVSRIALASANRKRGNEDWAVTVWAGMYTFRRFASFGPLR